MIFNNQTRLGPDGIYLIEAGTMMKFFYSANSPRPHIYPLNSRDASRYFPLSCPYPFTSFDTPPCHKPHIKDGGSENSTPHPPTTSWISLQPSLLGFFLTKVSGANMTEGLSFFSCAGRFVVVRQTDTSAFFQPPPCLRLLSVDLSAGILAHDGKKGRRTERDC